MEAAVEQEPSGMEGLIFLDKWRMVETLASV